MASYKDGVGQYTWGKYNATTDAKDIYIVGGSKGSGSDYFNIPESDLDEARSKNYGTGIHFWRSENGDVNITINLLLITTDSNQQFLNNGYYIGNSSADYSFFANIQYQTKDGNWVKLGDELVATYYGGMPLFKRDGWDTEGSGYLWKTFTYKLPLDNIKQFSMGIHGEGNDIYHWNYYKIEEVLKPVKKRLTIKYLNKKTNAEVRSSNTVEVTENTHYTATAPNISGYAIENPNIDVLVTKDAEYTVWYIPSIVATVRYLDRLTNRPLRNDDRIENLTVGQTINRTAPSIQGYVVENSTINYTVKASDNIITFYYRQVPKIRAWAIRQGGRWKSLGTINKHFKVRKGNIMVVQGTEDINTADVGKANYSSNRIRKSNTWKAQGKVGE